jgi:hypothetical protein
VVICFVATDITIERGGNFRFFDRYTPIDPIVAGERVDVEEFWVSDLPHFHMEADLHLDFDWTDDHPDAELDEFQPRFAMPEMFVTPSPQIREIAELTPPIGWRVLHTDMDEISAILHLQTETGNNVYALATKADSPAVIGDFREILINDTPTQLLTEDTHSILFFYLNNLRITLSTAHDYNDLLKLAQALLN